MANEIIVQSMLQVRDSLSNLNYQSQPNSFRADRAGTAGPTPGDVAVTPSGVDASLSALTKLGGLCRIMNKDLANWVDFGVFDHSTNRFYPLGEVLPGETYVLRLSRLLGEEFGTGSGTTGPVASNETLRFRSHGGNARVLVEAFDR